MTIRRQAALMVKERIAALRASSPTGTCYACQRCGYLAATPARHLALGRTECPAGAGEFEEVA